MASTALLSIVLFLTLAAFSGGAISAKDGRFCDDVTVVQSHDAELRTDGSLQTTNGTIYPKRTFWREDRLWHVCPCLIGLCIRYCPNSLIKKKNHTLVPDDERFLVWDGDTQFWVSPERKFRIIKNCKCDRPRLNIDQKYRILTDGTAYLTEVKKNISPTDYCIIRTQNEQIMYHCLEQDITRFEVLYVFYCISAVSLLLTLVLLLLSKFRTTPHGLSLICLVISLFIVFLSKIVIGTEDVDQRWHWCTISGYVIYYFTMTTFFWLNILCIEVHAIIKSCLSDGTQSKFLQYSIFAWGAPFIILIVGLCLDLLVTSNDTLHPGIGAYTCWFQGKLTELIFLQASVCTILLINAIIFASAVRLLLALKAKRSEIALRRGKEESVSWSQLESGCVGVTAGLCLFLGFVFLTHILVSWVTDRRSFVRLISDSTGALQGVFVFILCLVFTQLLDKLCKRETNEKMVRVTCEPAPVARSSVIRTSMMQVALP
ncbi:G-protein coupled receptor Mth2-like [Neocloeon triangulifer]|uniref:G-protein coupled receptor Mth2-like n=1 Tax=Neocloeon triangulifer TaxID=2078957 RepID=UPI00286F3D0D|nr:G-protein coupled receptor Mth2-like [Neocloeon triangulifer]XP_059481975.1 G-protein coupled receptor Mth2-like [Neocloeon triangulifer]